jgi:cytochrome P450
VKTLEEDFRKIVVDLIEPLAARGYGDGMKDIGGPLTAQVICEQLGFDFAETGAVKIARWSNAVIAQIGRMQTREEMLVNAREFVELQQYIIKNIREREVAPRDDMITDLINAHLEGEENPKLSFEEKVASIRAFLIAGNDTTAAAIGNMLLVLATQEGLLEDLYEKVDDNRVMNRFVEEILRIHPPVHGLYRTAMKDVVLGGTSIPALSQICIMFASANSDDEKFSCPRELDLDRPNAAAHLAFGSGIHRCIGASLSRMEIKVAAQEVIRRLTDIRLTIPRDKLTYLPTLATHTMEYLPLTFKRRGA